MSLYSIKQVKKKKKKAPLLQKIVGSKEIPRCRLQNFSCPYRVLTRRNSNKISLNYCIWCFPQMSPSVVQNPLDYRGNIGGRAQEPGKLGGYFRLHEVLSTTSVKLSPADGRNGPRRLSCYRAILIWRCFPFAGQKKPLTSVR